METLASDIFAPANADLAPAENVEVDTETQTATGDGSAPSSTEAAPPERDKVQERIDKLTREKYDALRERDQRDYELEQLRARVSQIEAAKSETARVAPEEDFPTLEKYGYDEAKFNAAVSAHYSKIARQEAAKATQEQFEQVRRAELENKVNQNWAAKEAEFLKSKPDYAEKVKNARTLPISVEVQEVLKGSEFGPQVAYHLVENPEVARAILRLPLQTQLMEVGRITARIEANKAPLKPAVSQAPPPPAKVDGTVAVEKDPSTMSDKEFATWRKRQIAQRR